MSQCSCSPSWSSRLGAAAARRVHRSHRRPVAANRLEAPRAGRPARDRSADPRVVTWYGGPLLSLPGHRRVRLAVHRPDRSDPALPRSDTPPPPTSTSPSSSCAGSRATTVPTSPAPFSFLRPSRRGRNPGASGTAARTAPPAWMFDSGSPLSAAPASFSGRRRAARSSQPPDSRRARGRTSVVCSHGGAARRAGANLPAATAVRGRGGRSRGRRRGRLAGDPDGDLAVLPRSVAAVGAGRPGGSALGASQHAGAGLQAARPDRRGHDRRRPARPRRAAHLPRLPLHEPVPDRGVAARAGAAAAARGEAAAARRRERQSGRHPRVGRTVRARGRLDVSVAVAARHAGDARPRVEGLPHRRAPGPRPGGADRLDDDQGGRQHRRTRSRSTSSMPTATSATATCRRSARPRSPRRSARSRAPPDQTASAGPSAAGSSDSSRMSANAITVSSTRFDSIAIATPAICWSASALIPPSFGVSR